MNPRRARLRAPLPSRAAASVALPPARGRVLRNSDGRAKNCQARFIFGCCEPSPYMPPPSLELKAAAAFASSAFRTAHD